MGMKFKDKIMLYCSREVKCKQGFTAGTLYYLYNGISVTVNMSISCLLVSKSRIRSLDPGLFSGGGGYELTFHFF